MGDHHLHPTRFALFCAAIHASRSPLRQRVRPASGWTRQDQRFRLQPQCTPRNFVSIRPESKKTHSSYTFVLGAISHNRVLASCSRYFLIFIQTTCRIREYFLLFPLPLAQSKRWESWVGQAPSVAPIQWHTIGPLRQLQSSVSISVHQQQNNAMPGGSRESQTMKWYSSNPKSTSCSITLSNICLTLTERLLIQHNRHWPIH
jgi:hypothetical protein